MNGDGNPPALPIHEDSVHDYLDGLYGLSRFGYGAGKSLLEHVLGLRISDNYRDVWVEYELGSSTFAITTSDMGHAPGAKGAVVAFEVSDLDGFVHKMKERAVSFVTETFDTPVCRMAVIADQDGNHITLHKRHK